MKNDTYSLPQSNHAQNWANNGHEEGVYSHNIYLERLAREEEQKRILAETSQVVEYQRHLDTNRDSATHIHIEQSQRSGLRALKYVITNTFSTARSSDNNAQFNQVRNKFIEIESKIGGKLFETSDGREHFFHYHDNNEWFWHSRAQNNQETSLSSGLTVRYFIDARGGIYRSENGREFELATKLEHDRFIEATKAYTEIVLKNIYQQT